MMPSSGCPKPTNPMSSPLFLVRGPERPAAVDRDLLTGQVRRGGRGKEQCQPGDVGGETDAVHGYDLAHGLLHACGLGVATADVGGEKPRSDGIDGNVVGGELMRDRAHQLRSSG